MYAHIAPDRSLVDELIAERREEARRENEKLQDEAPPVAPEASEPPEDVVAAIAEGATVSTANLAEVLSKLAETGQLPAAPLHDLRERIGGTGSLIIEQLIEADTIEIGRLRLKTRHLGLSLADRACLALAARLGVPAVTADTSWAEADVGVAVHVIR